MESATTIRSQASPDRTPSYNPGEVFQMSREEAERSVAQLAHSSPVEWYDYLNLSSAFFVLEHTDLALLNARRALAMIRNPMTLLNLAVILETLGGFYPAFSLSEEAYALDPSNSFVRTHYSDALLRMGRLAEAWPIYADSHANWGFLRNVMHEWDGVASLRGKRVLVLSGGGYGDNFLHLRWMPWLADLGATVTYMCPPSMHSLVRGTLGISHLLSGSVSGLEGMLIPSDYDYFTCIYSLAGYFCPTMEEIPTAPYLRAKPKNHFEEPHIGLCTRAGEEKFPRRHRSLNEKQKVQLDDAIRSSSRWQMVLNWDSSNPYTWKDTAELISACELVITVDTGVAHLSGALGVPCWVILPGISAAYYGVTGDRCAFYPSHRLFRNFGEGIDNSVADVCAALATLEAR
jgi:hypothetical protein